MWVPTRVQLADGLTRLSAGVFLRNALTSGTAQLYEESAKNLKRKQLTGLSRKIGGSEDTIQESLAQDPSLSTFSKPDYIQLHGTSTVNLLLPYWSLATRAHEFIQHQHRFSADSCEILAHVRQRSFPHTALVTTFGGSSEALPPFATNKQSAAVRPPQPRIISPVRTSKRWS